MKVLISSFERELLLAHPETALVTRELLSREESSLKGTPEQCDALREACADLLQRIGFDGEYKPTDEGRALERLIDKLLV